jgi:hypothetical protein
MEEAAVLLLGYKRVENIRKRLLELSHNIDIPIIISIDGGLEDFEKNEILSAVGELKTLNPNMILNLIFRPMNLGLTSHLQLAVTEVFHDHQHCIIIEDDISISKTFISNLLEASQFLERMDVLTVGGFSPFVPYTKLRLGRNNFRETRYFSAWGWMISREKWAEFEIQIKKEEIQSTLSSSRTWLGLSRVQQNTWLRRFQKVANEKPSTWDFQMQYLTFRKDMVHILPKYKICDNHGFGDYRGTNTVGRRPKWMKEEINLESETLSFRKLIKLNSIAGKFFNLLDSFFIAGDSAVVEIISSIKGYRKSKKR